jgi:hypothetical protein
MSSYCVNVILEQRLNALETWLQNEGAKVALQDQFHLDGGSHEQAYWHLGYHTALRDLSAAMTGAATSLCIVDTANLSPADAPDAAYCPPA